MSPSALKSDIGIFSQFLKFQQQIAQGSGALGAACPGQALLCPSVPLSPSRPSLCLSLSLLCPSCIFIPLCLSVFLSFLPVCPPLCHPALASTGLGRLLLQATFLPPQLPSAPRQPLHMRPHWSRGEREANRGGWKLSATFSPHDSSKL